MAILSYSSGKIKKISLGTALKQKKKKKNDIESLYSNRLKDLNHSEPICEHYQQCGGCDLQHFDYQDQVNTKHAVFQDMVEASRVKKAFKDIDISLMASPRQSRYRQKMDFVCAFGKSGLRGKSFDDVVELNDCHLIEEESFKVYSDALSAAREAGLKFYNFLSQEGFLRYITIRRTRTGQQLLSFLTASVEHAEIIEGIAKKFLDAGQIHSFVWQVTDGKSDSSFGTPHKTWGQELIEEEMLGYKFKLTSNTFFQANQEVAQEAYRQIRDHAASFQPETVLDLYSGTCTIGISLSGIAKKVIAVENFTPNRDMAFKNFKLNDISNIDYIDTDVAEYMLNYSGSPDYAVCNPPRTGVDERPLRALMKLKPKAISYLSCNPKTLLDDLSIMTLHYNIEQALVLDMFPQTKHFETLVQLRRKDV
jgi:23S rRNA (uracil1939-C5)-methyltransferase